MTKSLGIIGYPLGHTLSPPMHQAALDHLDIDARFEVWQTTPGELTSRMESLRDPNCLGACVSLPYKQAVIPLLNEITDFAKGIGAVNWIINNDGHLSGHNTDAPGFLRSLSEEAGFDPGGCNAVLFGAGGAARAVVYALREAGCARLTIANRTIDKAQALAQEMAYGRFKPAAVGIATDELADCVPYAELLVNSSSMGMSGGDAPLESPVNRDLISGRALGYDLVYAPPITPFLREVEAAGGRIASGLSMLAYQGIIGFELCTGCTAPAEIMKAALANTVADS